MKKFVFMLTISVIFGLFLADSAFARPHTRYHNHDGKNCRIDIMGKHNPISYDNVFLDKLIKHDKKTIKQAQDIFERADREEIKKAAQEVLNTHTQEKERLELLRKELFKK